MLLSNFVASQQVIASKTATSHKHKTMQGGGFAAALQPIQPKYLKAISSRAVAGKLFPKQRA